MSSFAIVPVLCALAAYLPAVSACSCRLPLNLEDEIVNLYSSPRVSVFSARLSEPIHNYEKSHQFLPVPSPGTQHVIPMTETFQNISVEITHTFVVGHGLLDQDLGLSNSSAEEQNFFTTHTQTTCCMCGASFDHNAPVGSSLVLVLQQGALFVSACGISCLSTGDMSNHRNRACAKTQELLEKFENTTERKIYQDQKKEEAEPWIAVDPRPPKPTRHDSITVFSGGSETNAHRAQSERSGFSGLPALVLAAVLCCACGMCVYCVFRRSCRRKEIRHLAYQQELQPQQYVAAPLSGATTNPPGPEPQNEELVVEGIVLDPNSNRAATEVDETLSEVDETDGCDCASPSQI